MNLSEKVEELEKEMNDICSKNSDYPKKRGSLKQSCLNLLVINYKEALIILKRIDSNLKRKRYIRSRTKTLPHKKFIDLRIQKLLHEDFKLYDDLKVDIKSLYLWVYHIELIFKKCNINLNIKELKRISYLRHKFITHITDLPLLKKGRNTQSGMKIDADCEAPEILFHDIFRKHKITGLKRFVKQAESYIPELKNETNIYEQIHIMYRHLNKLLGTGLKNKAEDFIENIGVVTEPPSRIADELLKSLKEYRRLKRV